VVHRKGELSKPIMDWQWPHQVALAASRCNGHSYVTIRPREFVTLLGQRGSGWPLATGAQKPAD
jgi:hypothetical protein